MKTGNARVYCVETDNGGWLAYSRRESKAGPALGLARRCIVRLKAPGEEKHGRPGRHTNVDLPAPHVMPRDVPAPRHACRRPATAPHRHTKFRTPMRLHFRASRASCCFFGTG
eukprot:359159-Chlamydomonas_euryale.AAC.14